MNSLLIDDHPVVRSAFRPIILEILPDTEIFEVSTVAQGLELVSQIDQITLTVIDINLNGTTAYPLISRISTEFPTARILVVSAHDDEATVSKAYDSGAHGFISKRYEPELVRSEILTVLYHSEDSQLQINSTSQRKLRMGPGAKPLDGHSKQQEEGLPARRSKFDSATGPEAFSRRERQIAALIQQGKSNNDIAAELFLSVGTVKNHVSQILQKLSVTSRTQAALRLSKY